MIKEFINSFKPLKLEREFAGVRLPSIKIESKYYDRLKISNQSNNLEFLKALCRNGYRTLKDKKYIDSSRAKEYGDRINYELDILNKLNFIDYILIVWDVVNFCNENGILVGPGRGSVAGSLVCYLSGITTMVDPIQHGLFFERFISPSRAKSSIIDGEVYLTGAIPDIDLDLEYLRRHEVVSYLERRYPDRVAKIINVNTLTSKSLIKDCGKIVAEKDETEMNQISDLIPVIFGKADDIEKVYKDDEKFKTWCDENKDVYDIALRLRGLKKATGIHASGIAISTVPITEICPIEKSKEGELAVGFSMDDVGKFCIKLDLLGLKTLTIIDGVCKLVGIKDMRDININDPCIYAYLNEFKNSYGIFQLESGTSEKITRLIKPSNIDELKVIMSIARPGALSFIKQYLENKKRGYGDSIHPLFDDILESNYQIPLFQENFMAMLNAVGFSLEEGYAAIKVISKKNTDEVGKWESLIKNKIKENKIPENVGDVLWKVLKESANYSFNLSHSVSYSILAAITVFLKANFPKEFLFWCLKMAKEKNNKEERISRICNELKYFGIKLLPPSLLKSEEDFTLEEDGIRYGIGSIKNVSEKGLLRLNDFKNKYPNKFEMLEAAKQQGIDLGILTSIIQAGAMSEFGESRAKLVLETQIWGLLKPKERVYCLKHGMENNYDLIGLLKNIMNWIGDDGKKICRNSKKTRLDTIKKHYQKYKEIYELNNKNDKLANYWFEKKILGYSYSSNLKDVFIEACPQIISIKEFHELEDKQKAIVVGTVEMVYSATSKKKKKYTKFTIEDGTGTMDCFVFDDYDGQPGKRADLKDQKKLPTKEGGIAAFRGKKFGTMLIIDDVSIQDAKIFMKLSDLKELKEDNKLES